jgi:uncharacterized protein with HEPN domain
LSVRDLEENTEKFDSIVRRLEIIGEATKRLSPEIRADNPGIPWRQMAGMRDWLIHGYDMIQTEIIYDTVTHFIPPLIPKIDILTEQIPDIR